MLIPDEQLERTCPQEESMHGESRGELDVLYTRIENMIKEREEKEQIRMKQLLGAISEQLNKNVAALFENIIQKEVRGPLCQKIEKVLTSRVDQKMNEVSNHCSNAVVTSIEGKALNQTVSKTLKNAVIEGIVPVIENGMNEIRLQILDRMKAMPLYVEKLEEDISDSKDDTFDRMVDTLNDFTEHIEEHPTDIITRLLETNIAECFSYVIGSNDPEMFLFLLDKLPPDAEIDLDNSLLVQFVQQMIMFIGTGWKQARLRAQYTAFLSNALSHIKRNSLKENELQTLQDSILHLLRGCPSFGSTSGERYMLDLIQEMGLY
ncbi:hypothetical protein NEAUS04_0251 [Nematocida ausubeli]|nr:hypothetical protein NEAUS05_0413 [Nematocida ausubeli]KAI5161039.1 hypothetical protein NEAUS04_0251 [Nematocida ausubeli]